MSDPVCKSIEWIGGLDGHVSFIDQTKLPEELVVVECRDAEAMYEAIKALRVRGAPAIGIAAAMGLVLGIRDYSDRSVGGLLRRVDEVAEYLGSSRPTAVNLFWALKRMRNRAQVWGRGRAEARQEAAVVKLALLDEAKLIRDEDAAMCRAIGVSGEPLIRSGAGVLTICNAGALATAERGTALAPMYAAHEMGRSFRVYACETRPLLQGSRLTAWELGRARIDVTLLCDGAVGALMQQSRIDLVITGADRIAANGDTANKIGTYSLAVLSRAHGIPFYVAAPSTTFDFATLTGSDIPIEERGADEIRCGFGKMTAPADVPCFSPAFDVTPGHLITGFVTEAGLIEPVDPGRLREVLGDRASCPDS